MSMRTWTVGDLDQIAAIEEECFSDPWTRRMLADSFLSDRFVGILLEEDGNVVAYGGMSVVMDEAEIQLVAVSEMYRRCGRGSADRKSAGEGRKKSISRSPRLQRPRADLVPEKRVLRPLLPHPLLSRRRRRRCHGKGA